MTPDDEPSLEELAGCQGVRPVTLLSELPSSGRAKRSTKRFSSTSTHLDGGGLAGVSGETLGRETGQSKGGGR